MFACTKDHPVDSVLVESEQPSGGPDTNPFCRVVDDLPDRLGWQMQTEQRTGLRGRKTLAAGAAVQKVAAFILSVLAVGGDVALPSETVILAFAVGTEALIQFAHGLPPAWIRLMLELI